MKINLNKNENIMVLAVVLFLITAVVALLLGLTNSVTADQIAARALQEQKEARLEVLPGAEEFVPIDAAPGGSISEIYEGKAGGVTVGYCLNVNPMGFGGEINMVVGITPDKTVKGVKITKLSETAGLGAKATEDKFISQYNEKSGGQELAVIKSGSPKENEIVAISGATITSKAVTDGVNEALAVVEQLGGAK